MAVVSRAEQIQQELQGNHTPEEMGLLASKEPTIREALNKSEPPMCGRCDVEVFKVGKDAKGVVCNHCTAYLAELAKYRGPNRGHNAPQNAEDAPG